jgi:hypothetical protein
MSFHAGTGPSQSGRGKSKRESRKGPGWFNAERRNMGGNGTGGKARLGFDSNHTESDRPALALRVFQTRLLCELFRLEWFRQWSELAINVLEKQPLSDCFCHGVL